MARAEKRKTGWQGIALCDASCDSAQRYGHCKGHKRGLSGYATKKEALAAAYDAEKQLQIYGLAEHKPDKLTLGEVAQLWFDADRDIRESTFTWYRDIWSAWCNKDPNLASTPIAAVTPMQVESWLKDRRDEYLSKRTLKAHLTTLSGICGYAVHPMGILDANPCAGLKPPKSLKPAVTDHGRFTVPELLTIANSIDPRYRMLVILSGFCGGFRFGEMAGLRAANVTITDDGAIVTITEQYSNGKWSEPKNAASIREVFVPPPHSLDLADHLLKYPPSETRHGTVFSTPRGAPLHYNNFLNRIWHPTLEALGLEPFGTHALRRSFVDICFTAKIPAEVVADIGGWAEVGIILNIYRGKSTPAKIAEAAKMISAATSVHFEPEPSGYAHGPRLIIAKGQLSDGRIGQLAVLPPYYSAEDFDAALNATD